MLLIAWKCALDWPLSINPKWVNYNFKWHRQYLWKPLTFIKLPWLSNGNKKLKKFTVKSWKDRIKCINIFEHQDFTPVKLVYVKEIVSTAKYFLKVVSKHSVSIKIVEVFGASLRPPSYTVWKTVRVALTKVFFLSSSHIVYAVLPNPGCGRKPALGKKAGWQRILRAVRWLLFEGSCLRFKAVSVPSLLPRDSWLFSNA